MLYVVLANTNLQVEDRTMRRTWEHAIRDYATYLGDCPSWREGFRAGWLDACLDQRSEVALNSHYGQYANGYWQGQLAHSQETTQ